MVYSQLSTINYIKRREVFGTSRRFYVIVDDIIRSSWRVYASVLRVLPLPAALRLREHRLP